MYTQNNELAAVLVADSRWRKYGERAMRMCRWHSSDVVAPSPHCSSMSTARSSCSNAAMDGSMIDGGTRMGVGPANSLTVYGEIQRVTHS